MFNFGYKFLDELQNTTADDNIVISPESLYTALTLILPGEIVKTLFCMYHKGGDRYMAKLYSQSILHI